MSKKIVAKRIYLVSAALLLAAVLVVFAFSVQGIKSNKNLDGATILKENINSAVVLCYAIEGFYPPSILYIEKNYHVSIDHIRYSVWYEVFAQNIPPVIKVVKR